MAERLKVTTLQESELPELEGFLLSVFQLAPGHRPFRQDVLRWKAFGAHPLAVGSPTDSRSYVVRYQGKIIGHGMLMPLKFRGPAHATITAQCIVDWAADPAVGGGGVLVYRHLAKLAGVQIGIGGSDEGKKTIQRLGFRMHQTMHSLGRVIRPWAYRLEAGYRDWKAPLRAIRDLQRQRGLPLGSAGGLIAKMVDRFDEANPPPLPAPGVPAPLVSARSVGSLNHALLCPIARMEAYLILRSSVAAGYFLLSRAGAECRIAELWIAASKDADSDRDWFAAAALAAQTAASEPSTSVVFTSVSTPLLRTAFERAGLRWFASDPVFLSDPAKHISEAQEILLSMLDSDAFYRRYGRM